MGIRGPQPGTGGRPRKPVSEKLRDGAKIKPTVIQLPEADDLVGVDMPEPREFLSAEQKSGEDLQATEIYINAWNWMKKYRCEHLVTQQSLEQYAMAAARWIQCEEVISKFGFLAKHPTTGAAITSPYVAMAREYSKHANALWNQIFALVRDNCGADYKGYNPQDDVMERLLTARSRRN